MFVNISIGLMLLDPLTNILWGHWQHDLVCTQHSIPERTFHSTCGKCANADVQEKTNIE